MYKKSDDGLCISCHMELCQEPDGCRRCIEFCDTLLNWIRETDKKDLEK